jgi:hypothetical protein
MKRLLWTVAMLATIVFSMDAQNYSRLWSKVQKAEKEGKPQTAAGYLRELEQKTIAAGDELEQMVVSEALYEQLGKYNWKEANAYYSTYAAVNRRVMVDSLDAYVVKYKDHPRIMMLLYRQLRNHKEAVDRRSRSVVTGEDYLAVRREAQALLKHKRVGSYKKSIENFIADMDSHSLDVSSHRTMAPSRDVPFNITTRNVDRVTVQVYRMDDNVLFLPGKRDATVQQLQKNAKQLSSKEVNRFRCEYNIAETQETKVDFPEPGIYVVRFSADGVDDCFESVNVSNVAGALRVRNGQAEIYAADYTTGKPFEGGTFSLYKNLYDKQNASILRLKPHLTGRYAGNGFASVETGNAIVDDKNTYLVRIEAGDDIYAPMVAGLQEPYYYHRPSGEYMYEQSVLFTDRMLYKPTDTIYFKVICYKASETKGEVLANHTVELTLHHSSSPDTVAQVKLLTNDMGSASGFFTLPAGSKNGRYYIRESYRTLKSIRVEEYKRPNFSVTLTPVTEVLSFGDVVKQSGTLKSFAGFSVAGGEVEYTITRRCFCAYRNGGWNSWYEGRVADGVTLSDNQGNFDIAFHAERPVYKGYRPEDMQDLYKADYEIRVRAVDPQGEVHEARISVPVGDIPLDMNILLPEGQSFEGKLIVDKDDVKAVTIEGTTLNGTPNNFQGTYTAVAKDGREVVSGRFTANEPVAFDFGSLPSGEYKLKARSEYRGREITTDRTVIVMSTDDRQLPFQSRYFYYPVKTEGEMEFVLGTTEEDLYLELEVFDNDQVLHHERVHLQNEMRKFRIAYDPSWRSAVKLSLYGFRAGNELDYVYEYTRPGDVRLDVAVETFRDKTTPGSQETMTIRAPEGSELLISIYDITTDRLGANSFSFYPLNEYPSVSRPNVYSSLGLWSGVTMNRMMKSAGYAVEMEDRMVMAEAPALRGSVDEEAAEAGEGDTPEFEGRTNFSELIAFYPHIRAEKGGVTTVQYTTTDLLTTFRVLVMAHDKRLFVGLDEAQFVVNKELMVMPNVPLFATQGDRLVLKSKLVNLSDKQIKGTAYVEILDDQGKQLKLKGMGAQKRTLLAGAQDEVAWTVEVPGGTGKLTVRIWFATPTGSDGEQHEVQVVPNTITLTEAASFIMGQGKSHKYYEKQLRQRFGAANPKIEYAEYSTLDAVKESLPVAHKPECENAINWINQLYINQMRHIVLKDDPADYASFREQAISALKTFQESDGTFAWFRGMNGNITITLYFLEKLGQLRQVGAITLSDEEQQMVHKAAAAVDRQVEARYDGSKDFYPFTYIRSFAIRSLWYDIQLSEKAEAIYRKFIKGTEDGWQDISILEKAQLCNTMLRASGTPYDDKSFTKRVKKLRESLKDYAVENPAIGCYFPNAVMPFRGLMNSEIYAHAQLMELFASLREQQMVDAIAQWLLLQKHNQAWENTVATTDAVHALIASKAKDLRFGAVYYTYTTKLDQVKPSGDQLTVTRHFFRNGGEPLADGMQLHVGDKISVRYQIYNTENRSFVQLRAMRPACFYPVDERSYFTWYGFYREVKASETNYYWELLPEENTTVTEEFYVTQEGTFNSGLIEIECLYAREYRGHTDAVTLTSK